MNQITAYIDGSNVSRYNLNLSFLFKLLNFTRFEILKVYGSSENRGRSLREGVGGRLLTQKNQRTQASNNLLPSNPNECSNPAQDKFCFRAGDLRVNEQVKLK